MHLAVALLTLAASSAAAVGKSRWHWQEPAAAPTPTAPGCAECHRVVHDEWKDSAHARAFVDPVFQKALASRSAPERCVPCHAPAGVLERLGQVPRARDEAREQGIDCKACHVRNGVVHGPDGRTTDAHPTSKDPAFAGRGSVALCSSCHDLRIADVLPLAREFRAARDGDEDASDASCIGCHMETVKRQVANDRATGAPVGEERAGRSHRLLGPGDAEFCAQAFDARIEGQGAAATLVLRNGAGHGVPGLARLRSFALAVQWLDAKGQTLHEDRASISWQDRLLVDEERRWFRPRELRAVAVRFRVDHVFADQKPVRVLDRTWELP